MSYYPSIDGVVAGVGARDIKDYSVGAQVGASGIMVGGGYRKVDIDGAAENGDAMGIGASYTSGPFSVGLSYLTSKVDGGAAAGDDKYKQILFSAAYSIGPGVDLIGALFNAKYEDEGGAVANENSGTGGAVGIHLRF
jgi:predicted porin